MHRVIRRLLGALRVFSVKMILDSPKELKTEPLTLLFELMSLIKNDVEYRIITSIKTSCWKSEAKAMNSCKVLARKRRRLTEKTVVEQNASHKKLHSQHEVSLFTCSMNETDMDACKYLSLMSKINLICAHAKTAEARITENE